jgi:hypothetical protein
MDISKILSDLRSERHRIDQAIAALEGLNGRGSTRANRTSTASTATAVTKPTRRRKSRLTPAGRRRLSEMMKKRWAQRKRAANAS